MKRLVYALMILLVLALPSIPSNAQETSQPSATSENEQLKKLKEENEILAEKLKKAENQKKLVDWRLLAIESRDLSRGPHAQHVELSDARHHWRRRTEEVRGKNLRVDDFDAIPDWLHRDLRDEREFVDIERHAANHFIRFEEGGDVRG